MRHLRRLWWYLVRRRRVAVVILVRHADVEHAAGSDPALSPAGSTRAEELRHVLGDSGLDTIYVTRWQRSKLTAAPLATHLGITPVQLDNPSDVVAAIRARPSTSTVLVVGHTDSIPQIIASLGGPSGLAIQSSEFDRMFVLSGRLTRLRYGA